MAKKYDNATEAAAKFITLPDDVMNNQKTTTEEQPKKKRGRPKKTEATNQVRSAYEAAKEDEERLKREGTKIKVEYTKGTVEQNKSITATIVKQESEASKPQKKSDGKAAFSVWLMKKTADEVKLYSAISGEKMTDLLEAALNEYMKNHKLTAKQKTEYRERKLRELDNI